MELLKINPTIGTTILKIDVFEIVIETQSDNIFQMIFKI